jgi:hypothetical protein
MLASVNLVTTKNSKSSIFSIQDMRKLIRMKSLFGLHFYQNLDSSTILLLKLFIFHYIRLIIKYNCAYIRCSINLANITLNN